jgi:holo-[acyl-carrier protein] synthase
VTAVVGIGTDLVDLDRFRATLERRPGMVDRLFTPGEQEYAERRNDPLERYAVRFAAKEAVMKAMGVGLWKFKLRDVEVVRAPSGQPSVALHGRAAELAAEKGVTEWRLTLTHTDRVAQAIAVAL